MQYGTAAERVARGVALLDEWEPGWWTADREMPGSEWDEPRDGGIDCDQLDITLGNDCVIGQLLGDFDQANQIVPAEIEGVAEADLPEVGDPTYPGDLLDRCEIKRAAWFGFYGALRLGDIDYFLDCAELSKEWVQVIEDRRRSA